VCAWHHDGISEPMEHGMKNRLKMLRAEHNWSQAELSEYLGVSRQTVHALETGKYDPSLPLAFKIACLFHWPIEAIFQYNPELESEAKND